MRNTFDSPTWNQTKWTSVRSYQCGIAQVVRHHDGWVKRRKVERRDRLLVEALLRLENRRALIRYAVTRLTLDLEIGHQQVSRARFPHDLR